MLPPIEPLRQWIARAGRQRLAQGHDCAGLLEALDRAPASYDALWALAGQIARSPVRADWPWVEPNDLSAIRAECPDWPSAPIGTAYVGDVRERVRTAFLASVCGCILGKPVEESPSFAEMRAAGRAVGEWPLSDYISEALLVALGRRNGSADYTTREVISYAGADDDLNYTIVGMLTLERWGRSFKTGDLAHMWFLHLPCGWQYGPERTLNALFGLGTQVGGFDWWEAGEVANVGDEACGALIRADAYGYACPGDPGQAAELAHRDAIYTHRRTGVYGAMFAAAAIAAGFTASSWTGIVAAGLSVVPARSRFAEAVRRGAEIVAAVPDWQSGAELVHEAFGQFGSCQIYQEIATLMNTLRFAGDCGEGICMQVAQGNDTDSFGCTAGSILGAWKGPEGLDRRWLAPFRDEIRTGLAGFPESSLARVADRMARLPDLP